MVTAFGRGDLRSLVLEIRSLPSRGLCPSEEPSQIRRKHGRPLAMANKSLLSEAQDHGARLFPSWEGTVGNR
jgi:hypothetical protein